jgi:hypothetical protein
VHEAREKYHNARQQACERHQKSPKIQALELKTGLNIERGAAEAFLTTL